MADTYLAWLRRQLLVWEPLANAAPPQRPFLHLAFSGLTGGPEPLPLHDDFARLNSAPGHGWRTPNNSQWGHGELRRHVAEIYGAPSPDNVLIVPGATFANFFVASVLRHHFSHLANPVALVEAPSYGPLFEVPRYLGFSITPLPRLFAEGYRITPPAGARADVAILSNPNNPTGVLVPPAQITSLLAALPPRALVVVDESFLSPANGHLSAATLHDPRVIVIGGLSKTIALRDLRAAWIIASGQILDRLRDLWIIGANIGSAITESIAADALRRRAEHEKNIASFAPANMELVSRCLDGLQSRGLVEWVNPLHGSIAFPKLTAAKTGNAKAAIQSFFQTALHRHHLSLIPGAWFDPMDPDRDDPHAGQPSPIHAHFRIGFGGQTDTVRAALARLVEAVEQTA